MKRSSEILVVAILIAGILVLCGCSAMQQIANMQKPTVDVQGVHLTGLSLDSVALGLDLNVNNPNPISATLAGFDYDLQVNNSSVVKGNENQQTTIQAAGTSTVEVPVAISFHDLYNTFKSLSSQDSTGYTLKCGLSVDLPVLGTTRIPVTTSGKIPNIKVPSVTAGSVKVNNISVSGADIALQVNVKNPNPFSFLLNSFNYTFAVGGSTWANGTSQKSVQVNKKGESTITIPVSLNFLDMGTSAYKLLTTDNQTIPYKLTGGLDLSSPDVPLLGQVHLPIDKAGEVGVQR